MPPILTALKRENMKIQAHTTSIFLLTTTFKTRDRVNNESKNKSANNGTATPLSCP